MPHSLKILFEDRHCLVVVKPPGLLSASDGTDAETMYALVVQYLGDCIRAQSIANGDATPKKGYVAPLHFLDRPVSGVMVYAKSSKAAARLNQQFKAREVRKTYLAVVEGSPSPAAARLQHYLVKDHERNVSAAFLRPPATARDAAKHCILDYRELAAKGRISLLQVEPVTGRSHQIRAQLSASGWPISGDVKYGAAPAAMEGIMLHAWRIAFRHPTLNTDMQFTTEPPQYWSRIWPNVDSNIGSLS